jgi:hypothetical protein
MKKKIIFFFQTAVISMPTAILCRRQPGMCREYVVPMAQGCDDDNSSCTDGMAAVGTLTGSRSDHHPLVLGKKNWPFYFEFSYPKLSL